MADDAATNVQAAGTTPVDSGAHDGSDGATGATVQTTGNGPDGDSFFDPKSIQDKPELMAAYKHMQSSYTKRMQAIREHQRKIDAFDAFAANPAATLQQLAAQYGYSVVQPGGDAKDFNPQSWEEVEKHFDKRAESKFMPQIQDLNRQLNEFKQKHMESYLDQTYPDWRTYEAEMMDTLRANPSLVKDPDKLYRASVPFEVIESRATKRALEKVRSASDNANVSDGRTTTKTTTQAPSGPLSFDQAVELAKKKLAANGVRGLAG